MREALPEFAERSEERLHAAAVGKRADEDAHVAGKRDPPVDERGDDVVQSREEVLQAPAIRDDIEQTPAECLRVRRQTFQIHAELPEIGLPDRHERLRGLRRLAEPAFHAGDHARRSVADLAELAGETVNRSGYVLHSHGLDDLLHGLGDAVLHVLHGRADALRRVLGLLCERGVFAETVLVEVHDGLVEVVERVFAVLHGLVQVVGVVAGSHHGLGHLVELARHGGLNAAPCLHVHLAGAQHLRVLGERVLLLHGRSAARKHRVVERQSDVGGLVEVRGQWGELLHHAGHCRTCGRQAVQGVRNLLDGCGRVLRTVAEVFHDLREIVHLIGAADRAADAVRDDAHSLGRDRRSRADDASLGEQAGREALAGLTAALDSRVLGCVAERLFDGLAHAFHRGDDGHVGGREIIDHCFAFLCSVVRSAAGSPHGSRS